MKILKTIIFLGLIFAFTASTAFAIPELQLYIEGSTYDSVTETWVIASNSFNLWVMGNVGGPGNKGAISNVFLSAAYPTNQIGTINLSPTTTLLVTDPSIPLVPITAGSGPPPTSPPTSDGSLQTHGIFGPGISWITWNIGSLSSKDSPVADLIDPLPALPWGPNLGQINVYNVTIAGYTMVHFDAFGTYDKKGVAQQTFAPFSHDAQFNTAAPIPEPATMLLLGSGLIGIGVFARKRFKK